MSTKNIDPKQPSQTAAKADDSHSEDRVSGRMSQRKVQRKVGRKVQRKVT